MWPRECSSALAPPPFPPLTWRLPPSLKSATPCLSSCSFCSSLSWRPALCIHWAAISWCRRKYGCDGSIQFEINSDHPENPLIFNGSLQFYRSLIDDNTINTDGKMSMADTIVLAGLVGLQRWASSQTEHAARHILLTCRLQAESRQAGRRQQRSMQRAAQ